MTLPVAPNISSGRARLLFSPESSNPKPVFKNLMTTACADSVPYQSESPPRQQVYDAPSGNVMAGLALQIGILIGESIASCFESRLGCGLGPSLVEATDPSLFNVIVRSDVKEAVSFKGDSSDTFSVQEWLAVVVAYMKKKGGTSC